MTRMLTFLYFLSVGVFAQPVPHPQAHAHNDYEHLRPLFDALQNGFTSIEADVHWVSGKLWVSHDAPKPGARTLEQLYLAPLDSLLQKNRAIFKGYDEPFYLMIDVKTNSDSTYRAIQRAVGGFPRLTCTANLCPLKIFISGNRPIEILKKQGYQGLAIDGRPADLGQGFSSELIPVVSDNFRNWSTWTGDTDATAADLDRVRSLAKRVHNEGKKLRFWAAPDHEKAWKTLLDAGVDLINTDRLADLNNFLTKTGKP